MRPLPAEIFHLVVEFLSRADFRVLCLVNKSIRAFTEPLLYSRRKSESPPPITQLLRTLLCRPQLSGYITNLYLKGNVSSLGAKHCIDSRVPVSSAEIDKTIAFVRKTRVRFSELWIEGLSRYLTILSFTKRSTDESRDPNSGFVYAKYSKLTYSILSRLKALELTVVRESYLYEEFYYDSGIDDKVNTPIIDLDSLSATISYIRDTLEDLTIFAMVDLGGSDQFNPAVQIKGSLYALTSNPVTVAFLVGFTQDTTKRVQEMIPKNVEFITLTYDLRNQNLDGISAPHLPRWNWMDYAVFGLIQSWMKDWKACTPNLRGISLVLNELDIGEWCASMRDQLRNLCAQAGVELGDLCGK
ncbi:uncharacterized protein N7511_009434 [Penicillium nucicola]|uniref:uncharacterized protein n=1 Tax=Penicillium nucicola TaxID=1850975 RepID=UPI0025451236|nr:uncharacterized protein N7511_009434 [Penicillium nucicola]KAJ5747738.1 hypothetical protein N7511_009434 [Penicillium nucicola]